MSRVKVKYPILLKLILLTAIPLVIVYSVILYFNYTWGSENSIERMKEYLVELTGHHSTDLNAQFLEVMQAPKAIVNIYKLNELKSEEEIYRLLKEFIITNPYIYGMTIAFEPYKFSKNKRLFSPYVFRKDIGFSSHDLSLNYNYLESNWYVYPQKNNTALWSEPYYDEGGGDIMMCTYSVPIYKDGELLGVATADVSLDHIREKMSNLDIMGGYTFIISNEGTYVYHPDKKDVINETIFSKAHKFNFPHMQTYGLKMVRGESGVYPFDDPISRSRKWLVFNPIKSCQWSMAAILPEKDILSALHKQMFKQLFIMIMGLCVMILIIFWASYKITNPIRKLSGLAEKIALGDLDVKLENIKGNDEIGELAGIFNKMVLDLKKYIKDITAATREKETIESELRIARNIQVSLIPMIFPPFPNRKEFDLYAENIPAKEVAGDFYDFFFTDEDHLAFLIADVSGKGISASLFMAVTKTLINAHTEVGMQPHEILRDVNENLCHENESAVFVTIFLGILDVRSGEIAYSNGGHNIPYIINKEKGIKQLENTEGIALGVLPGAEFQTKTTKLETDEILFLYTDGITEAMDFEFNEYSEERLEQFLRTIKYESSKEILNNCLRDVRKFTDGAEQSDDITLLVLRYLV